MYHYGRFIQGSRDTAIGRNLKVKTLVTRRLRQEAGSLS